MGKDPAFLWYPNDYLGGTLGMTFEERGAYVHLLMMQFNRGHMTSHMVGQEVGQLWEKLKDKFIQDEKGLWYNERLDIEKQKRQAFIKSRRNNIGGVNQHTKKDQKKIDSDIGHMTSHMENENKDIIFSKFYDNEILLSKNDEAYLRFVSFLFGDNDLNRPLNKLLNMNDQIRYVQFLKLREVSQKTGNKILDTVRNLENYTKKNYSSFYLTLSKWLAKEYVR